MIPGEIDEIGFIVLGGLANGLLRALARLDLADLYGVSRIQISVLNVAYPLVPEEVREFCAGKRAVLVVEEGSPDYVEQQINVLLRGAGGDTEVLGKGCLPRSGDYSSEVLLRGIAAFLSQTRPDGIDADAVSRRVEAMLAHKPGVLAAVGDIPPRPPNFCTGSPERPVFAAIKLAQRDIGPAPFSLGNSILGYGMSRFLQRRHHLADAIGADRSQPMHAERTQRPLDTDPGRGAGAMFEATPVIRPLCQNPPSPMTAMGRLAILGATAAALPARAGSNRGVAYAHRASGAALGRACDRSGRMCRPHQGLRRHPQTRRRQLSRHRCAVIAPALAGAMAVRQAIDAVTSAPNGGIARSGRRSLGQVPRGAGASAGSRHRR